MGSRVKSGAGYVAGLRLGKGIGLKAGDSWRRRNLKQNQGTLESYIILWPI